MEEPKKKPSRRLRRRVSAQFLEGLFIVVPIGIAFWILFWILAAIDGTLQPLIRAIFGRTIPGVGFVTTIILIYVAGVAAENIIGRRLIRYGEDLLARVPVFRYFYTGIKQFLISFSAPGKGGFSQVVLVEFPRKGMQAVGFVTNELTAKSGKKLFIVFIPTAPNPTTGFFEVVEEEDIVRTDISVEDALKMVVSAGAFSSPEIKAKLTEQRSLDEQIR